MQMQSDDSLTYYGYWNSVQQLQQLIKWTPLIITLLKILQGFHTSGILGIISKKNRFTSTK